MLIVSNMKVPRLRLSRASPDISTNTLWVTERLQITQLPMDIKMTISWNFHILKICSVGEGGEGNQRDDRRKNRELLEKLRDICLGSPCGIWDETTN